MQRLEKSSTYEYIFGCGLFANFFRHRQRKFYKLRIGTRKRLNIFPNSLVMWLVPLRLLLMPVSVATRLLFLKPRLQNTQKQLLSPLTVRLFDKLPILTARSRIRTHLNGSSSFSPCRPPPSSSSAQPPQSLAQK